MGNMVNELKIKNAKKTWSDHGTTFVFIALLIIFLFYAVFIALTLKPGIIPDEERHFAVSKQFSTTLGIPPDVPETLMLDAIIKQNPNLYFWINGRIINLVDLIIPSAGDWQHLVGVRILNVFYALGTVLLCYLFSKEIIDNKWWQLLPVFLLTNTSMFVFLAGGVNDDNLVHLACIAALYFMARILNQRDFITNSISIMIALAVSTLIKHRVFPFVFAVVVVWMIYILINRKKILPLKFNKLRVLFLGSILLMLIFGNLAVYGYNLLEYGSYLPACTKILTEEQCDLRIFYYQQRPPEFLIAFTTGWQTKMSITESIELGYPGPIKYFFTDFILFLFARHFGILGHRLFISPIATFLHIGLFFWMILVAIIYYRDFSPKIISILGIFLFYSLTLFIYIYNFELKLKFNHSFIQSRYMFSVIDIAYVLAAKILLSLPRKKMQIPILIIILTIYFFTGPLSFILNFSSVFSDWLVI